MPSFSVQGPQHLQYVQSQPECEYGSGIVFAKPATPSSKDKALLPHFSTTTGYL